MNLTIGGNTFRGVQIPVLWGTRAIVQDQVGRISVIDLSGDVGKLEILGDRPAPQVGFVPRIDGFEILADGEALYAYNPEEKILRSITLGLTECQVDATQIRVGTNVLQGNVIIGLGVGVTVTDKGWSIGGSLPPGLAKLLI